MTLPHGLKTALFLAKYSLGKPNALPSFLSSLRHQHLPKAELDALHWERLKVLLNHAYDHTPFYRRRFDSIGLHPSDVKDAADFARIPVLTREDLREHFEDLKSRDPGSGKLNIVSTGGSTGQPVKVCHPQNVPRAAILWRMQSWWGIDPGSDIGTIYREMNDLRTRLKKRVLAWPNRELLLDARSIDSQSIDSFIRDFNALKPPLLHGYVGTVDYVASVILDKGLTIHSPKAIWVTSSPLTKVQAQRIEKAFGAPVYDQYGCCEVYYLAAQCPRKEHLHYFYDVRRIDFLDEDNQPVPDGEMGNVAITDLENHAFPLIRYLNGDRSRAICEPCGCGLTLPLMACVKGRETDMIWLPDGGCISGDYITTLFDDYPEAVRQFQVTQAKDYSIKLLVAPQANYDELESTLKKVADDLEVKAGRQVPVAVEKRTELRPKKGKLRYVESEAERPVAR